MKNETLKYKLSRILTVALILVIASVMLVSLAACTNGDQNDTDPNNGNRPNENNGGNTLPNENNGNQNDQQGAGNNGAPDTLNGQTAEGTVYHILNSSATDADGASASEFMLVTDEGKHYYVKNGSDETGLGNMTRDTGTSSDGESNGSQSNGASDNGNNGTVENSGGGMTGITLGDRVRIDITEGHDSGDLAVVEKGKVTVIDKFEGTLLQAKVYTKTGLPAETLTDMNSGAGWYHQHFADYSDFGVFLDKYELRGYVESMGGSFEGEDFPTLDEEYFKNNSIHIFALPYYGGNESNLNGSDAVTTENGATVYKDGDLLYLMVKEEGYGKYLTDVTGKVYNTGTDTNGQNGDGGMLGDAGNAVGDAGKDVTDSVGNAARDMTDGGNVLNNAGNAARDITRGIGDAANEIADGVGDVARDVTDGITGRNSDGNADGQGNGGNASETTLYKLYIVTLGSEGNGLKTGVVLIDNK